MIEMMYISLCVEAENIPSLVSYSTVALLTWVFVLKLLDMSHELRVVGMGKCLYIFSDLLINK